MNTYTLRLDRPSFQLDELSPETKSMNSAATVVLTCQPMAFLSEPNGGVQKAPDDMAIAVRLPSLSAAVEFLKNIG